MANDYANPILLHVRIFALQYLIVSGVSYSKVPEIQALSALYYVVEVVKSNKRGTGI